jgi:hypothetical protein
MGALSPASTGVRGWAPLIAAVPGRGPSGNPSPFLSVSQLGSGRSLTAYMVGPAAPGVHDFSHHVDRHNLMRRASRTGVVRSEVRSASLQSLSLSGRLFGQRGREAVGHGHRNTVVGSGQGVSGPRASHFRPYPTFMTVIHRCCRPCRVRFTSAASAYLTACPECGRQLVGVDGTGSLLGFRLFDPRDIADTLPEALAVSLPTEAERRPPGVGP